MTLRFFAYYRDAEYAGCKDMPWGEAATLRDLGEQLCDKLGNPFAEAFFNEDRTALGRNTLVMVNGRRVEFLKGLDTPLDKEDQIQIFPVVAGG